MNSIRIASILGMLLLVLAVVLLAVSSQENAPGASVGTSISQGPIEAGSLAPAKSTVVAVAFPTDIASQPPDAEATPWPIPVTIVPVATGSPGVVVFPTTEPTEAAENVQIAYLIDLMRNRPGVIIGRGTNATPTTGGFRSYIVEEVALPGPTNFYLLNGVDRDINTIWRVTLTSDEIVIGDARWYVWLDNNQLGAPIEASEGAGVYGITAIAYDRSVLREGAVMKVSYGGWTAELPERLHLSVRP